MSKHLVSPPVIGIDSDDIEQAPIGGLYDDITVDPSSCGGSRVCMLFLKGYDRAR